MTGMALAHVASDLGARATTIDWRSVVVAVVAGAVLLAVIWLPRAWARRLLARAAALVRYRSRPGRAVLLSAYCVAIVAVATNVVPYDHLFMGHAEHVEADVHIKHCHVSPSTCSDAPITSGPGQLIGGDPLLIPPAMTLTRLEPAAVAARGVTVSPLPPPPRL